MAVLSVSDFTLISFFAFFLQSARPDWVLKWPGQLVIAGCQTYWTIEVSDALEKSDLKGYYPKLLSQVKCTYKNLYIVMFFINFLSTFNNPYIPMFFFKFQGCTASKLVIGNM